MSVYLGIFLDEVDEQLQILEEEILNLEKDSTNMETVQLIFRAAHTLKGSSAAMGFDKLKELTHKIENVFDFIRNQQLSVTTAIINTIFESIDGIKVLKEAIIQGNIEQTDIQAIINELEQIQVKVESPGEKVEIEAKTEAEGSSLFPSPTLDEYQKTVIKQALSEGYYVQAIYVGLRDDCILKSVRAFLIHNNLKEIGEVVASFPSTDEIETNQDFNGNLIYLFVTRETEQTVINIVNSISEIKTVHIHSLTNQNLEQFANGEKSEVVVSNVPTIAKPTEKAEQVTSNIQQTVRVDIERLEHLMNLVGELVIDQTRLIKKKNTLLDRYDDDEDVEQLNDVCTHLVQVVSELQEGMMKTRMLPIEQLFNRYPRMVRDLTQKAHKEIDFVIYGKETELDRRLIEEISDPIIHLLRNSIDHGIEDPDEREKQGKPRKGQLLLKAAHEENHIVLTISDDGKGIDPQKIKATAIKKGIISEADSEHLTNKELILLIFKSGVSTAKEITDISGRGVGMDIVRSQIEKLNGLIDIESTLGVGTTFTIKLPLTLAIIRSLLVELGNKEFAIPLANVAEIIRLNYSEIKTIKNEQVGIVRDRILPLIHMHELLGVKPLQNRKKRLFVVVIGIAEKRVGLVVDNTIGNQDIVIKPLGKYIGTPPYISGATIMGEGDVSLILDVASIVKELGTKDTNYKNEEKTSTISEEKRQLVTFILGEEEFGIELHQVKDIITVSEISEVMTAPVSVLGMINLRGKVIPVIDTRKRFNLSEQPLTRKSRIIIVEKNNELIGLLVDQVTEVLKVSESTVEPPPDNKQQISSTFFKGLCNLSGRITVLLDLGQVLQVEQLSSLEN